MNIRFIGILAALIVVAMFAVQNSANTAIHFLTYDWYISQALIIILAVVIGCLIGLMVSVLKTFKQGRIVKSTARDYSQALDKIKELEGKILEKEKENSKLNSEIQAAKEVAEKSEPIITEATEAEHKNTLEEATTEDDGSKISLKDRWNKFMSE